MKGCDAQRLATEKQTDYEEVLVDACRKRFPEVMQLNLLQQNIVFILGEGQQSYWDKPLWLFFIKTQSGSRAGPSMCIFSSYGSPANGPMPYHDGSAPVYFGPHNASRLNHPYLPTCNSLGCFSLSPSTRTWWKESMRTADCFFFDLRCHYLSL